MLDLTTTMPQSPGPYRCFVTLPTSAAAASARSPRDMHDYTQAEGNNKSEVIIWTSLCQAEETKCTHTDRKWHLRDENLFCVSSAAKKAALGQSKLQTFSSV